MVSGYYIYTYQKYHFEASMLLYEHFLVHQLEGYPTQISIRMYTQFLKASKICVSLSSPNESLLTFVPNEKYTKLFLEIKPSKNFAGSGLGFVICIPPQLITFGSIGSDISNIGI